MKYIFVPIWFILIVMVGFIISILKMIWYFKLSKPIKEFYKDVKYAYNDLFKTK